MIVTQEIMSFAFKNGDVEIDHIPLAEIVCIRIIRETDMGTKGSFKMIEAESDAPLLLQISTEREGHNSGRTYYMHCECKDTLDALNERVKLNAKAARKRAEARTGFQRVQYRVRKIYKSNISRWTINVLIGAVSQQSFHC